jgi:fructose-1,6-bisphosphatase/sedoheptulose 1,7-bisphosphatase-like protein
MKQIEYDTCMSEDAGVRVRVLPDGEFQPAVETGWKGRLLEIDLASGSFPLGALLEIEHGAMIYLGELQQQTGRAAVVAIEHSVNREALKPIQETWG